MDRIIIQDGGMPLKIQDFEFTHEVYKQAFKSIIDGLVNAGSGIIISGLNLTDNGISIIVTEGFYYDGNEIFFVPQGVFQKHQNYVVLLTRQDTTSNIRIFDDEIARNVYEHRWCELSYDDTIPPESIEFSTIQRLSDIIDEKTVSVIADARSLVIGTSVSYASGFTGITAYPHIQVNKNQFGDVMIIAAFSAADQDGQVATLPEDGYRPASDLVRSYYSGTGLAVLIVKKNGEIHVRGANTSVNYISIQYNTLHTDLVGYTVPTPIPD